MKTTQTVTIEHYTPSEKVPKLLQQHKNSPGGAQPLELAFQLRLIEINLKHADKPHVQLQLIKSLLDAMSSDDSTIFHYAIARNALSLLDPEALKNHYAVDRLARELLKTLNLLCKAIKIPPWLVEHRKQCEKLVQGTTGMECCFQISIFPNASDAFEEQFYFKDLTLWDKNYLRILRSIGPNGRKAATTLSKQISLQQNLSFWFRKPDLSKGIHYFLSPAFVGLAGILWQDIVKSSVHFHDNQVAALSTSVHLHTSHILRPKTTIVQHEDKMQIVDGSQVVGAVNIPAVPVNLHCTVFRGLRKLNSVYGHRLFRFEVQEPFRKKISGDPDFRVIKLDGGKTELAEILGFKGKKAITVLGELLHAQAHLEFRVRESSGNLIQLTKYMSPTTKREEGLLITVGTILLPYYIFEEGGLLIPLLQEPPLIGPNQSQAALFSLQMDVMAELSKRSMELFTHGFVTIPSSHWAELYRKNGISPSFGQQVHDRWTRDGDDKGKFLELIDQEQYTLGSEYSKEIAFLTEQGKRRVQASNAGKISSNARTRRDKK